MAAPAARRRNTWGIINSRAALLQRSRAGLTQRRRAGLAQRSRGGLTMLAMLSALAIYLGNSGVAAAGVLKNTGDTTCSAVEILTTAGTGDAHSADDPTYSYGFASGTNGAKQLSQVPGVSAWQLPYPAAAGIVASADGSGDAPLAYGLSREQGTQRALARITEVRKQCPETKFLLQGFSQGAHVMGDVAAQMPQEALLRAYLVSDPGRAPLPADAEVGSSATSSDAFGAPGRWSRSGALIMETDRGLPAPTTGGLAARRGADEFARGKVLSFCNPTDIACAAPTGGFLQQIAAWANGTDDEQTSALQMREDYANATPVTEMVDRGTFFTVMLPTAIQSVPALLAQDAASVKRQFDHAGHRALRRGTITKSEQLSMKLLGYELAEITGFIDGPQRLLEVLPALGFSRHHLGYTGAQRDFTTIGGVRVDDWIRADMAHEIAAYTSEAPLDELKIAPDQRTHRGLRELVGVPLWRIVDLVHGQTSPQARAVWEYFNL